MQTSQRVSPFASYHLLYHAGNGDHSDITTMLVAG